MFSYADKGYADQYEFIKTLENRFGRQDAEYLMDIYRSNWIKNSDFDIGIRINNSVLHRLIIDNNIHSSYESCIYPGVNIKYYHIQN